MNGTVLWLSIVQKFSSILANIFAKRIRSLNIIKVIWAIFARDFWVTLLVWGVQKNSHCAAKWQLFLRFLFKSGKYLELVWGVKTGFFLLTIEKTTQNVTNNYFFLPHSWIENEMDSSQKYFYIFNWYECCVQAQHSLTKYIQICKWFFFRFQYLMLRKSLIKWFGVTPLYPRENCNILSMERILNYLLQLNQIWTKSPLPR